MIQTICKEHELTTESKIAPLIELLDEYQKCQINLLILRHKMRKYLEIPDPVANVNVSNAENYYQ